MVVLLIFFLFQIFEPTVDGHYIWVLLFQRPCFNRIKRNTSYVILHRNTDTNGSGDGSG